MPIIPETSYAAVLRDPGDASQLAIRWLPTPQLGRPDEILVRVRATSVNPIEWKMRQGLGLPRAVWRHLLGEPVILGLDFSGTVADVQEYQVGDEVFGAVPLRGTYAEYLVVRPAGKRTAVALKPKDISHEKAALVPFAGLVALAGLTSYGGLSVRAPDARVLIVGASGGVGHLALQMAKYGLGAKYVVGVCSSKNAAFAHAHGADKVLAHDKVSIEQIPKLYPEWEGTFDLILDAVGIDAYYTVVAPKLLKPEGRFVAAALPSSAPGKAGEDVGMRDGAVLAAKLAYRRFRGDYRLIAGLLGGLLGGLPSKKGFSAIVNWMAEGKLEAHVAATYELNHIAEAHRASESGRTVGKISVLIP
jgi:NADPH:quinone reductase-like Zn-dependent oxidoreductase